MSATDNTLGTNTHREQLAIAALRRQLKHEMQVISALVRWLLVPRAL